METTTNLIIFHSRDTDGLMSGALLYSSLKETPFNYPKLTMVGYNYESIENYRVEENHNQLYFENFIKYDNIFITDILMNPEWFQEYFKYLKNNYSKTKVQTLQKFFIFDHHLFAVQKFMETLRSEEFLESKINDNKYNYKFACKEFDIEIELYFSQNSATKIVWDYVLKEYPDVHKNMYNKDKMIELISEYDTWQWIERYLEPNYYALYQELYLRNIYQELLDKKEINSYIKIFDFLIGNYLYNSEMFNSYIVSGETIYNEKLENIKSTGLVPCQYVNYTFIIAFNMIPDYISQEYIQKHIDNKYNNISFDAMIFLSFDDNIVKLSIRAINKEFDTSAFARMLGKKLNGKGGGHKGASGASFSISMFNEFNKMFRYGLA